MTSKKIRPNPSAARVATMNDVSTRELGRRLRAQRIAHELSQDTLASALGVTDSAICRWENGGRRISGPPLRVLLALGIDLSAEGRPGAK